MPQIVAVDDPMDPRIDVYRAVRERDLGNATAISSQKGRSSSRCCCASTRHETASVLLAEKRLAKLEPLLATLPATTPVYVAGQQVLDQIVGYHLHRGIMACGRPAQPQTVASLLDGLKPRALALVLFGIANHDNVGGIFRNAAAFGADAIILDANCCAPLYRKAIRVSAGAALLVPFARLEAGEDAVGLLARHGFECVALSPGATTPLIQLRRAPRMAALFGAEGPGLSPELLARTQTISIPMANGFDSLNVATTSGIVLHHLTFGG